jgi:hypothetical protein
MKHCEVTHCEVTELHGLQGPAHGPLHEPLDSSSRSVGCSVRTFAFVRRPSLLGAMLKTRNHKPQSRFARPPTNENMDYGLGVQLELEPRTNA